MTHCFPLLFFFLVVITALDSGGRSAFVGSRGEEGSSWRYQRTETGLLSVTPLMMVIVL